MHIPVKFPRVLQGAGHPRVALLLLVLSALLLGAWGAWRSLAPGPANAAELLRQQADKLELLAQQVATLKRSDQISRQANQELQAMLAERDEEVAGLRADVAFYERFVGGNAQRHGLSVHELKLIRQQEPGVWHFIVTLTQNLNRGAVSKGQLKLAVEVTDGGSMRRLDWSVLRQQSPAPAIDYAFKYFQQVEGDIVLPAGIKPVRVSVRLQPAAGAILEKNFTWDDATAAATATNFPPVGD